MGQQGVYGLRLWKYSRMEGWRLMIYSSGRFMGGFHPSKFSYGKSSDVDFGFCFLFLSLSSSSLYLLLPRKSLSSSLLPFFPFINPLSIDLESVRIVTSSYPQSSAVTVSV